MKRLVEAAARVLARDGPTGLGVNAVATEAQTDKKLIYRYFGGLDGLIEAMGSETALWIGETSLPDDGDYADRISQFLGSYGEKLRGDATLQKLLAWELSETNEVLRRLDQARSRAMQSRLPSLRGHSERPEGVDAPAVNAILLAALQYLALRGGTMGRFAGLNLQSAKDWARVMTALCAMALNALRHRET
jgi:AcrR family transcriptional regulator